MLDWPTMHQTLLAMNESRFLAGTSEFRAIYCKVAREYLSRLHGGPSTPSLRERPGEIGDVLPLARRRRRSSTGSTRRADRGLFTSRSVFTTT